MQGLRLAPDDGPFAVAVSGGADSMALSLLMADFAPCHFLTFDHGLRTESATEAKTVKEWLKDKGLSHTTLKWSGDKPKTGLPEGARRARYQAMERWCSENGVKYLVIAHHLEDQAETFLMRLLKGSGIDGLSAMEAKTPGLFEADVVLTRPLLKVPRARLRALLKSRGQAWFDDPTNENRDYTRVKLRKVLETSKNLTPDTLAALADQIAKAKGFLDDMTGALVSRTFRVFPAGYGVLSRDPFFEAEGEIATRALSKILGFISQADYPPAQDKVERLNKELEKKNFAGSTLHGCRVVPLADRTLLLCREARDAGETLTLKPGETALWDNRFLFSYEKGPGPLTLKALGEKGWEQLAAKKPEIKDKLMPHPVRGCLPALFTGKEAVFVPHLGFSSGGIEGTVLFQPKKRLLR